MPTATFPIAAGGDDQYVRRIGSTYPPSGAVERFTSATALIADRSRYTGPSYHIQNALLKFDTSTLPDDATVTGATLRLEVDSISNAHTLDATADWHLPTGTDSDYSETAQTTALTGKALSTFVVGSNDIVLENAGANVSKTGFTGVRLHVSGGQPPTVGSNWLQFYAFEHTTNPAPELIVTYGTAPGLGAWTYRTPRTPVGSQRAYAFQAPVFCGTIPDPSNTGAVHLRVYRAGTLVFDGEKEIIPGEFNQQYFAWSCMKTDLGVSYTAQFRYKSPAGVYNDWSTTTTWTGGQETN